MLQTPNLNQVGVESDPKIRGCKQNRTVTMYNAHSKIQPPHSLVTSREDKVSAMDLTRLEPMNDASQREFRPQEVGKKLLAIAMMILLIGCLVWTMG